MQSIVYSYNKNHFYNSLTSKKTNIKACSNYLNEIYGVGNSYTAEYWQYDTRLGRRWNVDPLVYPYQSPYCTFDNNPILRNDPSGMGNGGGDGEAKAISAPKGSAAALIQRKKPGIGVLPNTGTGALPNKSSNPVLSSITGGSTSTSNKGTTSPNAASSDLVGVTNTLTGVIVANILGADEVIIQGGLLNDFKTDEAILKLENDLFTEVIGDEQFGSAEINFSKEYKQFMFGGQTSPNYTLKQQAAYTLVFGIGQSIEMFPETWSVAGKRTTWAVRHADLVVNVNVTADGLSGTINYSFNDKLNLRPNGEDPTYDLVVRILGFIYHDLYGISDQMRVKGSWSKTYGQ